MDNPWRDKFRHHRTFLLKRKTKYIIPKAADPPRIMNKAPAAPIKMRMGLNFIDMNAAIKKVF